MEQLLAAIYANPDDLVARSVYADRLQEAGDPRGEFIALQLAGSDPRRQRELLAQHGKAWAGELDRFFAPQHRRFENGFFAGGRLLLPHPEPAPRDPAWALVRSVANVALALLDEPALANVRAVHDLTASAAGDLAAGKQRRFAEVSCDLRKAPCDEQALATWKALPDLRVLGVAVDAGSLAWLVDAPVFDRLEELVLPTSPSGTKLLEAVARRTGATRLRATRLVRGELGRTDGWTATLTRDVVPGPFAHLRAHLADPAFSSMAYDLIQILHVAPQIWLRSIEITVDGACDPTDEDREALNEAIARYPYVEAPAIPWDTSARKPVRRRGRRGRRGLRSDRTRRAPRRTG